MLQLYKSRDFALFFKDTFAFLRMHGAHLFKNYLLVNGIFLAVLIAMSYMLYTETSEMQALGLFEKDNYEEALKYIGEYMNVNSTTVLIFFLLYALVGILNYAFVPIYFKLYEKHQGTNFSAKEISNELFGNFGKLMKFLLATVVISIPLSIAAMIVMLIMAFTFIGIPFILFVIALVFLFYHSALVEYLKSDDKSVFDCYGYSLQLCLQQFFPSIGAVGIFMLILIIFDFVLTLIKVVILNYMGISILDDPSYLSDLEKGSTVFIIAFSIQIILFLINFLVSTTLQIHGSIVYYSLKEDRENIHTQNTIDTIGRD